MKLLWIDIEYINFISDYYHLEKKNICTKIIIFY